MGTKTLEIDYYRILQDAEGRKVILVKTIEGIIMTLKERPKQDSDKQPYPPTQDEQPNRNNRRRNTTTVLVGCW
jgi:hypothetical protein